MFAIVTIAGQQFKVEKDQKIFVHRLEAQENESVSFDEVLLLSDGTNVTIGAPAIQGALVEAKVLKHLKGDKVIVFKKKRRKGYQVKNGHRQSFTQIVIENIIASGATKQAASSKKTSKKDDLTKVEGIGPKSAEVLVKAGIDSFEKLSKTSVEKLKEILEAGQNLSHLVPETWAKQAELAAQGKWDELKKWQDELNGGRL